jgi:hypothetical protein
MRMYEEQKRLDCEQERLEAHNYEAKRETFWGEFNFYFS